MGVRGLLAGSAFCTAAEQPTLLRSTPVDWWAMSTLADSVSAIRPWTDNGRTGADVLLDLISRQPAWMRDAACREHPDINWFPHPGETSGPAKEVCGQCLVREDCGTFAANLGADVEGVWGGMTQRERRRTRAGAGRTSPSNQRVGIGQRPRRRATG